MVTRVGRFREAGAKAATPLWLRKGEKQMQGGEALRRTGPA